MNDKQDFTVNFKARDQGVGTFMKQQVKDAGELEQKWKAIGKAAGSSGLGQVGESFGTAGKIGGFLGSGGMALGGLAVVGAIGKEFQQASIGIENAAQSLHKFDGRLKDSAAELVRAVPFLGDAIKGFDDLQVSMGNFLAAASEKSPAIKGMLDGINKVRGWIGLDRVKFQESIADIEAEAQLIEAQRLQTRAMRDKTLGIISGAAFAGPLDAAGKVRAQTDADLKAITAARQKGAISEDELSAARITLLKHQEDELIRIKQEAADKRIEIARKENEEVLKIRRETEGLQKEMMITAMERSGNTAGAAIERSRQKLKDDLIDIQTQIAGAMLSQGNWDLRGGKIGALLGRAGTLATMQGVEEQNINKQAIKSVDDQIRENALKVATIRDAQRQRDDELRVAAFQSQQGPRTSNMDGRGVTGFFNQSKSIEDAGRKTADNTKATVDELRKLPAAIAQQLFTSGGFISL